MSSSAFSRAVLAGLWSGAFAASGLALIGAPPGRLALDAGLYAHVTGLLAGYLTAVMLILMSRVPLGTAESSAEPPWIPGRFDRHALPPGEPRDRAACSAAM